METGPLTLELYHTTEVGLALTALLLEQHVSTVTLGLPQRESSTVTYLMLLEFFRASMWGYIIPPQVSPVYSGKLAGACSIITRQMVYLGNKLNEWY